MNAKKMQHSTDLAGISSQDTSLSVEQYASLVAALYRGHFQEKPWEDFLAELRELCMPCQTVIGLRVPTPGDAGISYVGGADYSPEDMLNFANNYSALAPLVDLPDGETVALDDLITREQLHTTVYYQTFMKPYNQEQVMGFDIHRDGKIALFLRLIRGRGEPDFSARDRAVLSLLKPQFRELVVWMATSQSLVSEHNLYEQASSCLALGTLILDANLSIAYSNSIADQLLKNNSSIAKVGGKLRLMHHQEHAQLQQALTSLLSDDTQQLPQVITIRRQGDRTPLFLTMRQLPSQDRLDDTHQIALYMSDPELRQIDQSQLVMDAFGLTPQEARLVIDLANGGTLEDFASDTGVTKNTARSHLYASFRKVGVSQQSSLVSHVIRAIHGL